MVFYGQFDVNSKRLALGDGLELLAHGEKELCYSGGLDVSVCWLFGLGVVYAERRRSLGMGSDMLGQMLRRARRMHSR